MSAWVRGCRSVDLVQLAVDHTLGNAARLQVPVSLAWGQGGACWLQGSGRESQGLVASSTKREGARELGGRGSTRVSGQTNQAGLCLQSCVPLLWRNPTNINKSTPKMRGNRQGATCGATAALHFQAPPRLTHVR